ncbi:MAG: hypothetical protein KIT33_02765 [Candidatus Kapabacteria bacterium]|nr:hypothetical protein [Ignavibacteriota bacterium]MCW5883871.1 hypothetical protein [Candidatus Kapabacteria bacterium]
MAFRLKISKIILFLFSLFVISCQDSKIDEPIEIISEVQDHTAIKSDNIDSLRKLKEVEYLERQETQTKKAEIIEQVSKEKNLTKEVLLTFLPDKLTGFNQLPSNTGKTIENDTTITVFAKRQFKDDKGRVIIFDLFDYGKGNSVLNSKIYEMVPTDLDAPAYSVELPNAKGFFYWLDQRAYGHIEVLIEKRFVLMVRLSGFNRDDEMLHNYLKIIDINKIIKSSKN